jgi:hypothetical protein
MVQIKNKYLRMAKPTKHIQVLCNSGEGVRADLFESSKCSRHSSNHGTKGSERILWDSWKHQLHTSKMK